jgi:hypothetical protein
VREKVSSPTEYSDTYKDRCFYVWYENNKSFGGVGFLEKLPEPENGINRPGKVTLQKWKDSFGWVARADALDAEVSLALDQTIVDKRIQMFKEHAEVGRELIQKAREYLVANDFKDGNEALRALSLGIDTQRVSEGAAEAYSKIANMTEDQLAKEFVKLTGGNKKDEDFIETEVTDISDTVSDEEQHDE